MEFEKVLKERKSVRMFSTKQIHWDELSEILQAGVFAPSSGNVQNWMFIVVKQKDQIDRLVEALPVEQAWAKKASVLIVVCSDVAHVKMLYGNRGEALYAVQNCAAAIENMLLRATDLKIGSCWIGTFEEKDLVEVLELPTDLRPQAIIALGYGEADEEKPREPLQSFVFFEKYGQKERDTGIWPLGRTAKNIVEAVGKKKGLFHKR